MSHLGKATKTAAKWSLILGGLGLSNTFPKALTETGFDTNQIAIAILTSIIFTALLFIILWIWSTASKRNPFSRVRFGESPNKTIKGKNGWLGFFIFTMLVLSPIGSVLSNAIDLGKIVLGNPEILDFTPFKSYTNNYMVLIVVQAILSISVGMVMAFGNSMSSVKYAISVLWITAIGSPAFGTIILPGFIYGREYINPLGFVLYAVGNAYAVSIWTIYLQRSIRVKNTYTAATQYKDENSPMHKSQVNNIYNTQSNDNPTNVKTHDSHSISLRTKAPEQSDLQLHSEYTNNSKETDENTLYEKAWNEVEEESYVKGIWAKIYSENPGDIDKVKSLYIKQRVENIKSEIQSQYIEYQNLVARLTNDLKKARSTKNIKFEEDKINARDQNGRTKLINSVISGDYESALTLLAFDAEYDCSDNTGLTALDYAKQNNFEMAINLINAYKEILTGNQKDNNTFTQGDSFDDILKTIKGMSSHSKNKILKYLKKDQEINALKLKHKIEDGESIDAIDENGDTPLMRAIINGEIEKIKLLLHNGADINIEKNGSTVRGMAYSLRDREIIELIDAHLKHN